MPPQLVANQYPIGTRPGSPIEIIDLLSTGGGTSGTTGLRIPNTAEVDDIIVSIFAVGSQQTNLAISAFKQVPEVFGYAGSGFTSSALGPPAPPTMSQLALLTHRVRKDEAGTGVGLHWDAAAYLQWGLVSYTLRHVDPANIFDTLPTWNRSGTNAPTALAATGSGSTVTPGAFIIGAMTGSGGAGGGISPGPIPGWITAADAGQGQPAFGFVSGYIDMPVPGGYQGAAQSFEQPSGTGIVTNWNGLLVPLRAVQQPLRPGMHTTPAGPSIDVQGGQGVPFTASWDWAPAPGQGPQIAWLLARDLVGGGSPGFWNGRDNVWQAAPFWNFGRDQSYQFPDGAWINDGRQWNLYGAIMEGKLNLQSFLSNPITFTADPAPSVIVTGPVGDVVATPAITWLPTITRPGSVETAWKVRLFDSLQYDDPAFDPATSSPRYESGVVSTADETWTPPDGIRGGAFYQAWVSIQQTGGMWSTWEFLGFYANFGAPALATFTMAPDYDPVTGLPRNRIDITCHDTIGGGLDGTTYVTLYRYDPKTQTLVTTRNNVGVPVPWPGQTLTLYDITMLPNQSVNYAVRVFSNKAPPAFTLDDDALGLLDTAGDVLV